MKELQRKQGHDPGSCEFRAAFCKYLEDLLLLRAVAHPQPSRPSFQKIP